MTRYYNKPNTTQAKLIEYYVVNELILNPEIITLIREQNIKLTIDTFKSSALRKIFNILDNLTKKEIESFKSQKGFFQYYDTFIFFNSKQQDLIEALEKDITKTFEGNYTNKKYLPKVCKQSFNQLKTKIRKLNKTQENQ